MSFEEGATPDTQYAIDTDNALDALVNDREPEAEVDTEEGEQLDVAENDSDGAIDDADELDYLEIDDSDFDTKYKYGDKQFTLRELIEANDSKELRAILDAERQELESMRSEIESAKGAYEYTQYEDVPHQFLTKSLQKMVQAGTLPLEVYQGISQVFASAIEQGLYDPKGVESKFEQSKQQRTIEQEREAIEAERRAVATEREVARVTAKYGEITEATAKRMIDYIQATYKRTGEMPTLEAAAEALSKQGAFNKPAPTKKALADRMRKKQPAATKKPEMVSAQDALAAFYQ